MLDEIIAYSYAHPKFFERPLYTPFNAEYRDAVISLLPESWRILRSDLWMEAHPPGVQLPSQGFKLHVSASLDQALEAIGRVVPLLVEYETAFKIVADCNLHRLICSKRFARQAVGKFLTVYPTTTTLFFELAERLTAATLNVRGPFILSDRPCPGSRSIFYRYGGFRNQTECTLDGTKRFLMHASDGNSIPDTRTPYYQLPTGVPEPYPYSVDQRAASICLKSRYHIHEALTFSATGGVYRATDLTTGDQVVIKEARPHTLLLAGADLKMYATDALRNERRCLEHLGSLSCVPRVIDYFHAWENEFLVQSYIEGDSFASFRAHEKFIIMERIGDPHALAESCMIWKDIADRLLEIVAMIHLQGVIVGDISPVNVIRHPSTGQLTFIDFESARLIDDNEQVNAFNARWAFPGFRSRTSNSNAITTADDYYACGMLLYNLICPIHNIFELDRAFPRDLFLEHFISGGLPEQMGHIIRAFYNADFVAAKQELESWNPRGMASGGGTPGRQGGEKLHVEVRGDWNVSPDAMRQAVRSIAEGILALSDTSRSDRLWPADGMVFRANPMSIAHGASGIAIFLKEALGKVPEAVRDWMLSQPVSASGYPPGLYTGLAGIAWAFANCGWADRASEIMRLVPMSPLAFKSPFLYDGIAGWGMAALALSRALSSDEFNGIALDAGQRLLDSSSSTGEGLTWGNSDEPASLGMGFGNSGIALFFLNLWNFTQEGEFLRAAKLAMDSEVASGRLRERDGALLFGPSVGARVQSPYWLRGAGGVASALARLYSATGEERYRSLAERTAITCMSFFSAAPHAFEGIASMGETLLDMYQATGDLKFREAASLKVSQALLFASRVNGHLLFPGRYLMRYSCDYGTGAAGIGMFVWRFCSGSNRIFHDLVPGRNFLGP